MKRTIKKQFWFSRDEAQDLQKKAKKTCLSEAALVRLLLRGYEPKEKPDDRFYDAMREFSAIGNNIHQISVKANALGFIDTQIKTLTADRTHLRNEIRKVNITDAELSQAKASISLLTEKLKELRKEVKLCQDIAVRSKVIEEKVDAVRAEEEKSKRKENRNYEQRR